MYYYILSSVLMTFLTVSCGETKPSNENTSSKDLVENNEQSKNAKEPNITLALIDDSFSDQDAASIHELLKTELGIELEKDEGFNMFRRLFRKNSKSSSVTSVTSESSVISNSSVMTPKTSNIKASAIPEFITIPPKQVPEVSVSVKKPKPDLRTGTRLYHSADYESFPMSTRLEFPLFVNIYKKSIRSFNYMSNVVPPNLVPRAKTWLAIRNHPEELKHFDILAKQSEGIYKVRLVKGQNPNGRFMIVEISPRVL